MTLYLTLAIILFLGVVQYTNFCNGSLRTSKTKNASRYVIIMITGMVVLQSIRDFSVGGDLYESYIRSYEIIGKLTFKNAIYYESRAGIGYLLFTKAVYAISNGNFRAFLCVISILYHCSFLFVIKKYSHNTVISLYVYLTLSMFNNSMNNLKSTLALTIILFAMPFLLNRKLIRFSLLILVSSLFHSSALVFFVLVGALAIRNKHYRIIYIVGVVTFILFGFRYIQRFILAFIPAYSVYLENASSGGGTSLFVLLVLIAVFIYFYSDSDFWRDRYNVTLYAMFVCAIALQLISFRIAYFERAVTYHLISLLLLIPRVFKTSKIKNGSIVILAVMIGFAALYIFTLTQNYNGTVPYTTFFSK